MAKLFIVEDHALMRDTLRMLLEREVDFEICGEAASVHEALAMLTVLQPDLVLIDVSLPDQDGLILLEQVRKQWPNIRCAILSGHDEAIYGAGARAAGAVAYIPKHDVRGIVPAIRQALNGAG